MVFTFFYFLYYKYILQEVDNAVLSHNSQLISEFEREFV